MKVIVALVTGILACSAAHSASAQLQPVPQVGRRSHAQKHASKLASDSVKFHSIGDHRRALASAKSAIDADPKEAWGYYVRGDALVALRHTDDAVVAFEDAERRAPAFDPWAKSVAIWGAAHALEEAARCSDADPIYERYADFTEGMDPAAAALARESAKKQCAPLPPSPLTQHEIDAANQQTLGNYARALTHADAAIQQNPADGWGYYMRADALASLRRFDEAVAAFREAQRLFPLSQPTQASIAIWGEANALKEAGRCEEASPVYLRYAMFVAERDPRGAAMAREYAKKQCVPVTLSR